jgi:hypothetical protein
MADEFYSLSMCVLRGLADWYRWGQLFFSDDTEQSAFLKSLANEENQ